MSLLIEQHVSVSVYIATILLCSMQLHILVTGTAVINPETAPTVDCGKGMVKDVVFAEIKKAVCRIASP